MGQKARDKATGVEGKITGRAEYLKEPNQYYIDGNKNEQWTDEENVEVTTE